MIHQKIRLASPRGGWSSCSPDAQARRAARRGRSRGSSNPELGHPRGTMAIAGSSTAELGHLRERLVAANSRHPRLAGRARVSNSELDYRRERLVAANSRHPRLATRARRSNSEAGVRRGKLAVADRQFLKLAGGRKDGHLDFSTQSAPVKGELTVSPAEPAAGRVGTPGCPGAPLTEPDLWIPHPALRDADVGVAPWLRAGVSTRSYPGGSTCCAGARTFRA